VTKVEQVAHAVIDLLAQCGNSDIEAGIGWVFQSPLDAKARTLLDAIGRAAIQAMREPTDAMLSESRTRHFEPYVTVEQWRAMIDAALNEGHDSV